MLTKVVEKLRTGSIKSVVPFGSPLPAPPYVVVKPEADPRGRRLRVIAHRRQGEQLKLEDYIFNEVSELLRGFSETDRHGNRFKVYDDDEWFEIAAISDDSTISMERMFFVPQRMH